MEFHAGEDVEVEFQGRVHRGEVVQHSMGWVLCLIEIDPAWDYGRLSEHLDPRSTVCVRETHVQHIVAEEQSA